MRHSPAFRATKWLRSTVHVAAEVEVCRFRGVVVRLSWPCHVNIRARRYTAFTASRMTTLPTGGGNPAAVNASRIIRVVSKYTCP
jgi:hypothetical protein